jgi:hypothetical protein
VAGELGNERRDLRVANIKAELATIMGAAPKIDAHPAFDATGALRTGTLDPDVAVDMTATNAYYVTVKLPDATPTDPGTLAGADDDTHCAILLELEHHAHGAGLGTQYPAPNKGDLLVVFDPRGTVCTADVILHELGHLFGLSPLNIAKDAFAPGVTKRKAFNETEDVLWKTTNSTKGHLYDSHGHQGPHCAYGLSDTEKGAADYSATVPATSPKCIMYGSTWSVDADRTGARGLCPQCLFLMRARDYTTF